MPTDIGSVGIDQVRTRMKDMGWRPLNPDDIWRGVRIAQVNISMFLSCKDVPPFGMGGTKVLVIYDTMGLGMVLLTEVKPNLGDRQFIGRERLLANEKHLNAKLNEERYFVKND